MVANQIALHEADTESSPVHRARGLHRGPLLKTAQQAIASSWIEAIDPSPAIGESEQDIGEAAAKNDWDRALPERVKLLTEACRADPDKVRAYARLAG